MKIKIVHFDNDLGRIYYPAFRDCFDPHFTVETYSAEKDYDRAGTVFVLNTAQDMYLHSLLDSGYKVIVENLQENSVPRSFGHDNLRYLICVHDRRLPEYFITVPWFFWYRESRLFDYRQVQREYNKATHKFLLMMNYQRDFRDEIYEKFSTINEQGLISYVDRDVRLPGDQERGRKNWDRYINPDWYNQTQFSVVVETSLSRGRLEVFITEKTTKPLALKHPFVTLGCPTTVHHIRKAGFETFGNLFREQYDLCVDDHKRIDDVFNEVCSYKGTGYDNLTIEKLEYNQERFYNKELVNSLFTRDIIDPILEFVNCET